MPNKVNTTVLFSSLYKKFTSGVALLKRKPLHVFRAGLILLLLIIISPLQHYSFYFLKKGGFYTENDSLVRFTVVIAGDAMVHSTQFNSAYIDSLDIYDFSPVFQFIRPVLATGQLNIVNLETTLGDKPYSGYPNFSSPDTFAAALREAGFNYFAMANNHCVDKGKDGILRTLDVLNTYGISATGTFSDRADRAQRYPQVMEINTIKTAVLNYTYGTNGIPVPEPCIVNTIDTGLIRSDIAEARNRGAEAVLVYFHWGNEYEREANTQQRSIAAFTFRCGADIIIGSHPHVVQPVELFEYEQDSVIYKKWVIWSLGNFVSNQRDKYTDGGIMARFDVCKNIYTGAISISDITPIPCWVYRPQNPTKYYILPALPGFLNDSIIETMNSSDKGDFDFFSKAMKAQLEDSL